MCHADESSDAHDHLPQGVDLFKHVVKRLLGVDFEPKHVAPTLRSGLQN